MKLAMITEELIDDLVLVNAAKYEVEPAYWIEGQDFTEDYCRACAEKEVERLFAADPGSDVSLGGGYVREHDTSPSCFECSKALDGTLTNYGCEAELDHFEANGFDLDSPSDCYSMGRIMGSVGLLDDELAPRIRRVIRKAIAARDRKHRHAKKQESSQ